MDAKPKLKIGQRVFFLVPKLTKKGTRRKSNKRCKIESGEIHSICDTCVIIKTKNQSVYNRKINDIFLSSVSAKKMI